MIRSFIILPSGEGLTSFNEITVKKDKLKLKGVSCFFFLRVRKKIVAFLSCASFIYIFIYLFIYLYILPHRINITERKRKNITKIANLQGRKSYKNSSKLNVILSYLTFLIDRVARKPNRTK